MKNSPASAERSVAAERDVRERRKPVFDIETSGVCRAAGGVVHVALKQAVADLQVGLPDEQAGGDGLKLRAADVVVDELAVADRAGGVVDECGPAAADLGVVD